MEGQNFLFRGRPYKTCPHSAVRGGFVQCGHFADKGVLQMRTSKLFGEKISDFSKFIVRSHGQRGMGEPVRIFCHFADKEGGVNFSRFCADVFYGWLLTLMKMKE